MLYLNLKLPKKYIILSLVILALSVLLVVNLTALKHAKKTDSAVQSITEDFSVADYIESFGPVIDRNACQIDEVTVPFEFGEVYNSYNQIQISQGFDLLQYKGVVLKRYTYPVLNFPEGNNVYVEVLIYSGSVVAADIYSTDLDGFLIALK